MPATVISSQPDRIVLQIEVPVDSNNMLSLEDSLQRELNEAGLLGTKELLELLERFEPTNKAPFIFNQQRWSHKGKVIKHYETLYGSVPVERSVYQGTRGGTTLAPLDILSLIHI